ncbi:MAG: hypothetical protein LBH19_02290 [Dysgonamonadaceae bacterium]|jgi:hypothetical protein|nr:hypothetical protein [Dysgonamonadaceae bacterium]
MMINSYRRIGTVGTYKNLLLIFLIATIGGSCDKEEKNNRQNNLTGIWNEFYPCKGCTAFTFSDNGDFFLKYNTSDQPYKGYYQMLVINYERLAGDSRFCGNDAVF